MCVSVHRIESATQTTVKHCSLSVVWYLYLSVFCEANIALYFNHANTEECGAHIFKYNSL